MQVGQVVHNLQDALAGDRYIAQCRGPALITQRALVEHPLWARQFQALLDGCVGNRCRLQAAKSGGELTARCVQLIAQVQASIAGRHGKGTEAISHGIKARRQFVGSSFKL